MKNFLLCLLFVVFAAGCSATESAPYAVGSPSWYQEQLVQLNDSLNKGQISQAEFEELKATADQRHLKWKVGGGRGVRVPR